MVKIGLLIIFPIRWNQNNIPTGVTKKEILLSSQASLKSKWIRCIIALVIPHPMQGIPKNLIDKQILFP